MGPDSCLLALSQGKLGAEAALMQAERALEQAGSDPRWSIAACMALWKQERFSEAYALHQAYQHHLDQDAGAWVIAGMCARRVPQHQKQAEQAFNQALKLNPNRGDAYYNLGNLYSDCNRYQDAIEFYKKSLAIDPSPALTWHNLGVAYRETEQLEAATSAIQTSILLDPFNSDTWCNLGLVYHAQQHFERAKSCYLHSIQLNQSNASSWVNMGMFLLAEIKPEEALPALRRGHSLNPSCPDALFNLALTLLLLGDYAEGWRLYESRFTSKNFKGVTAPSDGPWITNIQQLEELTNNGRTCLVWSEQGIGDSIQFFRYLTILKKRKIPFIFATRSSLVALFREWGPPGIHVIDDNQIPPDLKKAPHLALLSLPRIVRTELSTIPCNVQYLQPPGPPAEKLLALPPPGGINIGLVWASNPENKSMYRLKSISLDLLLPRLMPCLANRLINIHSLQVGSDTMQLDPYLPNQWIHKWDERLQNFADTAHIVHQMDLVISVDTATAHLSAALGIPTWILLAANCDFRWMLNRTDSPWYDMVRLFRQPSPGQWQGPVDQLIEALGEVIGINIDQLAEVEY